MVETANGQPGLRRGRYADLQLNLSIRSNYYYLKKADHKISL
ncbi:MAG: hypothetical protein K0S31_3166 [Sphingobacterium multivorum]|nr:hypothetical protein [Sphingobacterium multivorum]